MTTPSKTIENAVDKTLEIELYISLLPTTVTTQTDRHCDGQANESVHKEHLDYSMLETIKSLTEQVEQLKVVMSQLGTHSDSLMTWDNEMILNRRSIG